MTLALEFQAVLAEGLAPKTVRVKYAGWQPGFGPLPGQHTYHLLEDIPGHPAGSTVTRNTIAREGYEPHIVP